MRQKYQLLRSWAMTIQSSVRGYLARVAVAEERAAIKIQSMYRSYTQRQQYIALRNATIMAQVIEMNDFKC